MKQGNHRRPAWSVVLAGSLLGAFVGAFVAACDEDRPTPVVKAVDPADNPNGPPKDAGAAGKNPISGHRKSAYGKAYDVAENLVDEKIPAYNRKIEEEVEKNKQGK
ncbi:MAG: hypothetical protein FJ253_01760 [Phycisphaerae bacterium]|nr:hypothetical protein [Phycisphaerae bacterium]